VHERRPSFEKNVHSLAAYTQGSYAKTACQLCQKYLPT
jgi:hypothetical protein